MDRTAPAAPTGVTAAGRYCAVEIAWAQGEETDLWTYSVYRADTEDGEYTQIADGLDSLNYLDRSGEIGTQYAYRVRVCDRAGNLSEFSQAVLGTALADGEAPEIATILPEDGSTLGPNGCMLQVLAMDNSALDSVLVEYSTDNATWHQAAKEEDIQEKGKWITCTLTDAEWTDGGTVYVRAAATDAAGNASEPSARTYQMDITPPETASAEAAYSEDGNCVVITWQGMGEPDLAGYLIYRKTSEEGDYQLAGSRGAGDPYELTDEFPAPVAGEFVYRIDAVDNCGNTGGLAVSCPVPEGFGEEGPTAELSCDTAMEAGVAYRFDASASTGEITEWHFDFGDGGESTDDTEDAAFHAYEATGEYTVTLTVTDANGRQDSTARKVLVGEAAILGTISVTVMDENNAGIPGAFVYLDLGDEHETVKTTDGDGAVSFTAAAGSHKIGAIIPGNEWLPAQTRAVVTAGETTNVTVTLTREDLIEGSFDTHQMTFDEIAAAGIDPTDPANRNYVKITLHLRYRSRDYTESFHINLGDWGTDDDGVVINMSDDDDDHRELVIKPIRDYQFSKADISLAVLDVPVGISALKDFFEVRMHIINNASSEFSFLDNTVSLHIPDGLSLMQTYRSEKSAKVSCAEIRGQTQEDFLWILRGDAMGDYRLSADYSGILSGFNTQIGTHFEATDPIHVAGLTGASVTIEIADQLDRDRLYYNVLLENKGDSVLYCPDIETEDDLIRMDLFNAATAERAKRIRYDAISLDELSLSVAPEIDPHVFEPGALLIKQYVTYDEVQYTEKTLELEESSFTLSGDYGIEVTIVEKPLEWFTNYLGIGVKPAYMEESDLQALRNNRDYIYWCMYALRYDSDAVVTLKSKTEEFFIDLFFFMTGHGSLLELFDWNQASEIEALIASAMGITVEKSEAIKDSETVIKWLKGIKKALKEIKFDKVMEEVLGPDYASLDIDIDASELIYQTICLIEEEFPGAMVDFVENGDGNYPAFFTSFMRSTDYYQDHLEEINKLKLDESTWRNVFGGTMTSDGFKTAWQEIGYSITMADLLVKTTKDTYFDLSVAIAAQKHLHSYKLFLDALINGEGGRDGQTKIKRAAEHIERAIDDADSGAMIALENFITEAKYKTVEWAGKKGMKYVKEYFSPSAVLSVVKGGLNIAATLGDAFFNVTKAHDISDNILFLSVMSEDVLHEVDTGAHTDAEIVQLYSYLLQLRRMGESQVAQFGICQEIIPYLADSEELFNAVRKMNIPPEDFAGVRSWQDWRDYTEDRISALGVRLLHKPVYPYGVYLKAPVVTVDYARCETAQRFSDDYMWRDGSQSPWIVCNGGPIPVTPGEEPYVLMVRNAREGAGEERLTAAVLIEPPIDLSETGITITPTETGYRLEFPDNDLTYSYTLSEEIREYEFTDELEVQIPEGSYSCELDAGSEIKYLYLRSAATPEQFASRIWEISLEEVVLGSFVFSPPVNGTVELIGYTGHETHLEIPDTIPQDDGTSLKVVGIGEEALKDNTTVETVWIPQGIATIGKSAFEGCTALTYAAMPESMKTIGNAAFRGCTALSWASLPTGVATIGKEAFKECAGNFKAIVISGSQAEAELKAAGVSCRTAADLPAMLTEIRESAFEGSGFAGAVIPAGCSAIGRSAFTGCGNLHAVYLESGTTEIDPGAFPDQVIVFYVPADSEAGRQLEESGYRVYFSHN